ncbi:DUF3325 domain-containing protein [Stenotrophomonas sp. SY1]|uniref:DUF3325 domain-containing protein n=1 Tax=Stenotrophomonas sp. SY1 TaxID=477235 RepID=UPI001E5DE71D|nr:DUF3325 domain-containing protein [Stenotrophomonas sp. SY1]MCD9085470.1 DUF3325 domain-containing protein [Stenotrophomonas sp. SY1]
MSEHLMTNLLLAAALLVSLAGMGWLALSMDVHAQLVWGTRPSAAMKRVLRWLGIVGIGIALCLCLAVDHASMAVLVWVMALTGGALLVAFTLSSKPQRLRLLAPWVK